MGGGVVDIMQGATDGNAFVSYAAVFVIEIIMLMIAFALSFRLEVGASQAYSEEKQVLGPLTEAGAS
jgi:hypothetical protein